MFYTKKISFIVLSTLFYLSCESAVFKKKILEEKYKEITKQKGLLENENKNHEITRVTGQKASIKDYPYIASVTRQISFIGSAVILNKLWLVTAGYTIWDQTPETVLIRYGTDFAVDKGQSSWASKLIVHPNISSYLHDIGLIKLKKPIKFNKNVKAIKLTSKPPTKNAIVSMSGYGFFKTPENQPQNIDFTIDGWLRSASLKVMTYESCKDYYPTYDDITNSSFCTTPRTDIGPCLYDFGSPLVEEKEVIGVFAGVFACLNKFFPPVFTDIYTHKEWIEQTIKENSDPKELEDLSTNIEYF